MRTLLHARLSEEFKSEFKQEVTSRQIKENLFFFSPPGCHVAPQWQGIMETHSVGMFTIAMTVGFVFWFQ